MVLVFWISNFFINKISQGRNRFVIYLMLFCFTIPIMKKIPREGISLWFSWCYSALQYLLWKWNIFLKKTHKNSSPDIVLLHCIISRKKLAISNNKIEINERVFVLSFFNVKSKWGTTNCTRLEPRHATNVLVCIKIYIVNN